MIYLERLVAEKVLKGLIGQAVAIIHCKGRWGAGARKVAE